ncbi:hypothetical protein EV141_2457 [Microcella putealis]|uniref:FMN-binding protein n=1 Tax=Microcella putealis TaxID=337005 RepID=A0A4Q7LIE4_9MICO|nr:hypothetical protein [Microcella putealis]RZS53507.1 hypothetical protein EV141_2457 [Microcella putealis]TQM26951.1 hypothetical protein BJ957_0374 [Microcella putealis]
MTRLTRPAAVPLYAAAASLTLLGALTACSPGSMTAPGDVDAGGGSGSESTNPPVEAGGDYADGTYSASGTYISPNGTETVDVEVTIEGNTITAVTVDPNPTNPTTSRYQTMFAGGIEAEVVGKAVDEVEVTRVAGSSLTGGGFTDALNAIKADALAG